MRRRTGIPAVMAVSVLAGTLLLGALAVQATAALRHLDGTVLAKNAGAKTFRITTQGGSRVTVKVNASTDFERIAGFSALTKGMKIEVEARTTNGGLLATQVEPKESGGGGGDDGGGHRGGGHGGDDGPNHH